MAFITTDFSKIMGQNHGLMDIALALQRCGDYLIQNPSLSRPDQYILKYLLQLMQILPNYCKWPTILLTFLISKFIEERLSLASWLSETIIFRVELLDFNAEGKKLQKMTG